MTVPDYLKSLTGAPSIRAAAATLAPRLGISEKAIEMAVLRKSMPGRWYPTLLSLAESRGMDRPPASLFTGAVAE